MISEKTFTSDWINALKETLGTKKRKPDPGLIEKAVVALHLLEMLCLSGVKIPES